MKTHLAAKVLSLAILFLAIAFITGCKTVPKVDWDSRVGNYTFDQAVTELGQPSKQVKFDDGKFAVQWITLHGGDGLYVGGGYGSGNYGMGASQTMAQSYKDHVLELTFGPDNKLVSWAKNY
jgi:hypothetical protein